jgi:hypothetical protein
MKTDAAVKSDDKIIPAAALPEGRSPRSSAECFCGCMATTVAALQLNMFDQREAVENSSVKPDLFYKACPSCAGRRLGTSTLPRSHPRALFKTLSS